MGIFGRKKQVDRAAEPDAVRRVEGIVRRGLAENSGDLPPARLEVHSVKQGFNPYDSSPGASASESRPKNRSASGRAPAEKGWKESGFNPYDTYSNLPKQRSWEDVPFDSVDKTRRKR